MGKKFMPMSVLALTLGAFCIGTSEFVIMGLLPDIAKELEVSIPRAGLLVTAYALGVVFGGPVMAVLTNKLPRKETLLGLLAVFTFGNVCCALAPSYELLMAARVLTALCHGTFFGIASVAATQMVESSRRNQAIAWVFMGTTLANMLGVPLGTAEGYYWGWRSTFWTVAIIGFFAAAAMIKWVPGNLATDDANPAKEFKTLLRPSVQIPLWLSALTNANLFVVFTYIAPLLITVTHVSEQGVTYVLLILGVGLPIGTLIGGKMGDWNLVKSLFILIPLIMAVLVLMHWAVPYKTSGIMTLFLWDTLTFTVAPILQFMVVNNAAGAPNLASTFNQSAFNAGNAFGAWLGSVLLSWHVRYEELPFASIILLAAALALVGFYVVKTKKAAEIKAA